jgi:hypothetical protein
MGGFWNLLGSLLAGIGESDNQADQGDGPSVPLIVSAPSARVVIQPESPSSGRTVIGPQPRAVVNRIQRAAWDEKEWIRSIHNSRVVYTGYFRASHNGRMRQFAGRIVETRSAPEAYIADPPPEIKRHPKGPCFALTRDGWFRVHWHRAPADVDNAILYVEKVLNESFNR